MPVPTPPSRKEDKQVSYFLLFREQVHDGPLYTQARTWHQDASGMARAYGQEQINQRYGASNKASEDPFLAMPTYSQRFERPERALPDLESQPFAKEFFPKELHATLEGEDRGGSGASASKRRKTGAGQRKKLALSNITTLRTAEHLFLAEGELQKSGEDGYKRALDFLEKMEKTGDGEADDGLLSEDDEDDWVKPNEVDDGEDGGEDADQYEDESENDYNAEQYFDGNQDDEDYNDGGDDGGGGGGGDFY